MSPLWVVVVGVGDPAHQENLHLPIQTKLPNDCLLSTKTVTQNKAIYDKIWKSVAYIVSHLCSAQTIDVKKTFVYQKLIM